MSTSKEKLKERNSLIVKGWFNAVFIKAEWVTSYTKKKKLLERRKLVAHYRIISKGFHGLRAYLSIPNYNIHNALNQEHVDRFAYAFMAEGLEIPPDVEASVMQANLGKTSVRVFVEKNGTSIAITKIERKRDHAT